MEREDNQKLGFSVLMEHKEADMISHSSHQNLTRLAHFLIPTDLKAGSPPPDLPRISMCGRGFDLQLLGSLFRFRDYFEGDMRWKNWARKLHSEYEMGWKKAGIYEAIGSSAYETPTDADVIIAIAEKWSSETNTFMFPWGEATVTLEDVNVLGGFSVLGGSVRTPLQVVTEAENALNAAFCEICEHDCHIPRTQQWMKRFQGQRFEHEAFITLWLSRFVFPCLMCDAINKQVFGIAVSLAQGHRLALAPAILASVYRGFTNLKKRLLQMCEGSVLKIYEPLYLVQLWVWERFPALRPRANLLDRFDVPRVALWKNVKRLKRNDNVRLALETAGEAFVWRPYMSFCNGWIVHPMFKDKEQWILIDFVAGHVRRDVEAFGRCVRVAELVGFSGFVEKYLPNRVSMQFGFDQDIPGYTPQTGSNEMAWINYSKPLENTLIYIPSRISESCVTKRYNDWWRESVMPQFDQFRGVVRRPRSLRNSRKRSYQKEYLEAYSMDIDRVALKEAVFYKEWSKKARLLRQQPEELDVGGGVMFSNTKENTFKKGEILGNHPQKSPFPRTTQKS